MIRIRHPGGTATYKLEAESTLASLRSFIHEQTGIAATDQELKTGYPPKNLSLHGQPSDLLLSSPPLNLKKGEQVVVARRSGSESASAASASSLAATPASSTTKPVSSSGPTIASLSSLASKPSTPQQSASSTVKAAVKDGEVSVRVDGGDGFLSLKVVPDDNSCLFNSVGFLFEQRLGSDVCQKLRQVVADVIRQNPEDYPDVVLGHPRDTYISKILSPQTWGGAIELSILSSHFKVELDSIDVASGVVHKFGEDKGYDNRGVVVYSGIHYDALTLLPTTDSPVEFGTTLFPSPSLFAAATGEGAGAQADPILDAARRLCDQLKQRRYYTDTASFTLKCKACGQGVKGEKEAVQHAKSTGHADFGEY